MEKQHLAMCGLNCSVCPAFVATKNNDGNLREKTAKEWTEKYTSQNKPTIKPEDINCSGCLSNEGPLYRNCSRCEIRKCGLAKGIKNCQECNDYRCDKLIEMQKHLF